MEIRDFSAVVVADFVKKEIGGLLVSGLVAHYPVIFDRSGLVRCEGKFEKILRDFLEISAGNFDFALAVFEKALGKRPACFEETVEILVLDAVVETLDRFGRFSSVAVVLSVPAGSFFGREVLCALRRASPLTC